MQSRVILALFFLTAPFLSLFALDSWDPSIVDTGRSADWLSDLEKDVVREQNMARVDPARYAEEAVQPLLSRFRGNLIVMPGEIALQTNEGPRAVTECIAALKRTQNLKPLQVSRGLSLAARDQAQDQAKTGQTGHSGADGSNPFTRMRRYGTYAHTAGENITYGFTATDTARRIVVGLLIDDGVSSRGHRANILSSAFGVVGLAAAKHKVYGDSCVFDFADSFTDSPAVQALATSSAPPSASSPVAAVSGKAPSASSTAAQTRESADPRADVAVPAIDITGSRVTFNPDTGFILCVLTLEGAPVPSGTSSARLAWAWGVDLDVAGKDGRFDGQRDLSIYAGVSGGDHEAQLFVKGFKGSVPMAVEIPARFYVEGKTIGFEFKGETLPGWTGFSGLRFRPATLHDDGHALLRDSGPWY